MALHSAGGVSGATVTANMGKDISSSGSGTVRSNHKGLVKTEDTSIEASSHHSFGVNGMSVLSRALLF